MNLYDTTDLLKFSYEKFPVILPISEGEAEYYLKDMETRDFFGYLCFYGEIGKEKTLTMVSTRFGNFLVNKAARETRHFDLIKDSLAEEAKYFLENRTSA